MVTLISLIREKKKYTFLKDWKSYMEFLMKEEKMN